MLAESIVLELCRSGALDRNIEFVKGALRDRRDALVEALGERIPEAEFVVPGGGYFLWLDLAEGTDTPTLLAEAKGEGVAFVAGPDFTIDGGRNSLRLSFASVPPERIAEGVARIARALERVRAGSPA
jgi:DNA-binding transcriptional MocR family regulator